MNASRRVALVILMIISFAIANAELQSQQKFYLLRVDRAKQQISMTDPAKKWINFTVETKSADGKTVREERSWLPVLTKTVRLMAPEGPKIPNDQYGKYCESPPADGKDGMYYKVGPIEDVPQGSMDFGFHKIRMTGKPADLHGRTGLLIHGGGKNRPDPLEDFQGWQCTHGCIRMQNAHVRALVGVLKGLPRGADVRLIIDGGKCKLNGITAETYTWENGKWVMGNG